MRGTSRLVRYANFVRLPHTVFALPFALVGVVIASYSAPVTWRVVGWVVLAFTAARFVAMGFNRIVDRHIDAANPRTAIRELPSGVMSVREAWLAVVFAAVVFVFAAWRLNPLCGLLAPVALAWVCFYSVTKRFTRWSHLVLGIGMGIAPAGGYLAVTGAWSDPAWLLPALAAAVMTWGGGFDVLYALQDVAFDRERGLHSLPASVGVPRAIQLSRAMHGATVMLLAIVVGALAGTGRAGALSWVGVGVAAALLAYEHTLVSAEDQSRLDAAFFTMNGVISIVFCTLLVADRAFA
ncbi:MAG: 4-hydroxybenzoate octaprenyltransferase [Gemmatimonadetes bacterium]|nr:4-hydroxybenzoate octaprenyltransferase [Gemmatimonadota bacterium]